MRLMSVAHRKVPKAVPCWLVLLDGELLLAWA